MTVRHNVEFAFKMHGLPVEVDRVDWALETVNLADAQHKRPSELSGGMKARTAIARAWANPKSRILLLDESLSALDEVLRQALIQDLLTFCQTEKKTVIYVTHTIPEAIERANATSYGLAAGIVSENIGKAMGIAKRLRAGSVWINYYDDFDAALPFGGYKESGWGRDKSEYALENYMEIKTLSFPIDQY